MIGRRKYICNCWIYVEGMGIIEIEGLTGRKCLGLYVTSHLKATTSGNSVSLSQQLWCHMISIPNILLLFLMIAVRKYHIQGVSRAANLDPGRLLWRGKKSVAIIVFGVLKGWFQFRLVRTKIILNARSFKLGEVLLPITYPAWLEWAHFLNEHSKLGAQKSI